MFQLTVTGGSLAELAANCLSAGSALGNDSSAQPAAEGRPSSGSAGRAPAASQGKGASSPKAQSTPKDDGEHDADEIDYDTQVKPKIVALGKDFGREAVVEVLEDFTNPATGEPATKGQEVDPSDYPQLLAALKKARDKHTD